MKTSLKPYFLYTKAQRLGLMLLFASIIAFQLLYYVLDAPRPDDFSPQEQRRLSQQTEIDSLKTAKLKYTPKVYPYNPNFITDFKGYKLGMTTAQIDRLLAFRETGRYVNSAEEFQAVTKVPDALLRTMAPNFKFPDWVKNKKTAPGFKPFPDKAFPQKKPDKITITDINQASKEALVKIYGIGDGLSERILKEKEKLGGFVSMEQMKDIWGLSDEVIEQLNLHFQVLAQPKITKLRINEASIKELMKFPYFRYALAKEVVTFRSMNNGIRSAEDLIKINGFPVEKVKIIALYLEF